MLAGLVWYDGFHMPRDCVCHYGTGAARNTSESLFDFELIFLFFHIKNTLFPDCFFSPNTHMLLAAVSNEDLI